MAGSEADSMCRKHPNENPQPGICASCLRDRLSGIASGNNNTYLSSPSAAYYYFHYSSASSSGGSSPAKRHRGGGHQRFASDIVGSIYLAVSGNKSGLKKSRSMAFASRNINGERDDDHGVSSTRKKEKKKGGFWNRLLLLSSVNKLVKF